MSSGGSSAAAVSVFGETGALSEREANAVTRMLSDPTYFPMEFKAWIKNYIESSDIQLPSSAIVGGGGGAAGARTNLPPGLIVIYAGSEFGPDVLPCNGAAVSRTDYDKLFAAVGVLWGPGDSSTTFNVPDFRDRGLYGVGSVIGLAVTDGKAVGNRGGPFHHHSINMATDPGGVHKHNAGSGVFMVTGSGGLEGFAPGNGIVQSATTSKTADSLDHTHVINGDTLGGYDNKPSYAGVNLCITTGEVGS